LLIARFEIGVTEFPTTTAKEEEEEEFCLCLSFFSQVGAHPPCFKIRIFKIEMFNIKYDASHFYIMNNQ
tara:strand:- start:643 stop:849 length:207 start_codon:yes stop_codon:yes gene_type:complete